MPTLAQIRAAIVAKIGTVPAIGKINDYERYARDQSALQALYVADLGGGVKQLRGWNLRRVSTREGSPGVGRYQVAHTWQIRGFMALDDSAASEKIFDDLVEAVRDAFRADENLGGLISSTVVEAQEGGAGVQVDEALPVFFAGVLCHAAKMRLTTIHYL